MIMIKYHDGIDCGLIKIILLFDLTAFLLVAFCSPAHVVKVAWYYWGNFGSFGDASFVLCILCIFDIYSCRTPPTETRLCIFAVVSIHSPPPLSIPDQKSLFFIPLAGKNFAEIMNV